MKIMIRELFLSCTCGAMRGVVHLSANPRTNRFVCYCDDCQTYAHFLGRAYDILDPNGGTEILPVAPSCLEITAGQEHLKCVRLSSKGMYRWYASCCHTPIGNSPRSPKFPYIGLVHTFMHNLNDPVRRDKSLGPVSGRVQGRYAVGDPPPGTLQTASLGIVLKVGRFLTEAWLRRMHSPSPFFDSKTGLPVVEPYVLSLDERETFRGHCGSRE